MNRISRRELLAATLGAGVATTACRRQPRHRLRGRPARSERGAGPPGPGRFPAAARPPREDGGGHPRRRRRRAVGGVAAAAARSHRLHGARARGPARRNEPQRRERGQRLPLGGPLRARAARREERPGRAAPRDAGHRGRGRGGPPGGGRVVSLPGSPGEALLRRGLGRGAVPALRRQPRGPAPAPGVRGRDGSAGGDARREAVAGRSSSPPRTAGGCRRSMRSTGCRWPSSSTGAASPARGFAGTWSTPAATTTAAGWRRRRRGRAPSTSPRGSRGPGRAPRSW